MRDWSREWRRRVWRRREVEETEGEERDIINLTCPVSR